MTGTVSIGFQSALLWVLFACIIAASAGVYARNRGTRCPRSDLALYCGVFGLALVLRLFVSPLTLIHENAHGYEYLQTAFSGEGYPLHGTGYYAFYRLITLALGQDPVVVFGCNAILSSLTAVLLVWAGAMLTGDRNAGRFAGFLFAIWPAALRIAASESMFPLALFVGIATLCAWLSAVRSGDRLMYVLAGLLLAFAVQVRPVMALWPIILAIATISQPGWRGEIRKPGPWLAVAVCAVMSSGWLAFRVLELRAHGVHGVVDLSPIRAVELFFSVDNLLWNSRWTPVSAVALAVLGLAALIRKNWRASVVIAACGSMLCWFTLAPSAGEEVSQLRLQSPIHLFAVLGAGSGAAFICGVLPQRFRWIGATILAICLFTSSALRFDAVRESYNPQEEFRFLEESVGSLPDGCTVVAADKYMAGHVVATEFPRWWLEERRLARLDEIDPERGLDALGSCVVWYRGLTCSTFTLQERVLDEVPATGFREECARFEEGVSLTPVVEISVPNKPYLSYLRPERDVLELGFYRVSDRQGEQPNQETSEEPPQADAQPELADAAIANAEALLGEPYRWGGRMTSGNPGIDCLGLLYLAYGPPTQTPWRRYPVDPSKIVRSEMLGAAVPGADGVLRGDLDVGTLRRGDVLYLLMEEYEIEDDPLLVTESARYWPWHTALYVGGEEHVVIHAAPGGVVRKQSLETMQFDGLFVTRLGTHATPPR